MLAIGRVVVGQEVLPGFIINDEEEQDAVVVVVVVAVDMVDEHMPLVVLLLPPLAVAQEEVEGNGVLNISKLARGCNERMREMRSRIQEVVAQQLFPEYVFPMILSSVPLVSRKHDDDFQHPKHPSKGNFINSDGHLKSADTKGPEV